MFILCNRKREEKSMFHIQKKMFFVQNWKLQIIKKKNMKEEKIG